MDAGLAVQGQAQRRFAQPISLPSMGCFAELQDGFGENADGAALGRLQHEVIEAQVQEAALFKDATDQGAFGSSRSMTCFPAITSFRMGDCRGSLNRRGKRRGGISRIVPSASRGAA